MIVFDAPLPPPNMQLITTKPHHQAVEIAIRIARIQFVCVEKVDSVEWLRLLSRQEEPADFILTLPNGMQITIEAIDGMSLGDADVRHHSEVRGAEGVLHLAARLSSLLPA